MEDKMAMNGNAPYQPSARARGVSAWVFGLVAIVFCVLACQARLPSLAADWAVLFLVFGLVVVATAARWPERQSRWRGHRIGLTFAIFTLACLTALAALYEYGLYGLDHLTM